jgi:hypothetical protein
VSFKPSTKSKINLRIFPHVPLDSMLGLTIKQTVREPNQKHNLFNIDARGERGEGGHVEDKT